MEKRSYERIPYNFKAKVISGSQTFTGFIENISEGGIEYLITSQIHASKDITPEKMIHLSFMGPAGESISLTCEVKWYLQAEQSDDELILGMQILDPSKEFKDLLKTLH